MSKVIKLNESDLVRLVQKVISENRRRDENGDLVFEFTNSTILLRNFNKKKVQYILSKLPETIKFLAIVDCEGADFSDIVICSFPSLISVNLKGTPNNFEENVECEYDQISEGLYRIVKVK